MLKTFKRPFYLIMLPLLITASIISIFYTLRAFQFDSDITNRVSINKPKVHLVLISQELDNPYWRQIEHGAKIAAEKNNVILEYVGPVQANMAEQIKLIEMAMASKIDGILTQGLNDQGFTPIINKAMDMGIPVITIDSDVPESKRISYVGTDNYAAGFMAGRALIKDSQGIANVGIITGSFDAVNQRERVRGFQDAVKKEKGIQVVDMKESNIDRIQSAAAAYSLINEHPELDTFFGTSALDGLGIVQMLNDAKNSFDSAVERDQKIRIIGFDDLPETVELIDKGIIDATIIQQPYQMGMESVELMLDYISGQKIVTVYNTDVHVMRKSNLQQGGKR